MRCGSLGPHGQFEIVPSLSNGQYNRFDTPGAATVAVRGSCEIGPKLRPRGFPRVFPPCRWGAGSGIATSG